MTPAKEKEWLRRAELQAIKDAGLMSLGQSGLDDRLAYAKLYRVSKDAIRRVLNGYKEGTLQTLAEYAQKLSPEFLEAVEARSFDLIQEHVEASFAEQEGERNGIRERRRRTTVIERDREPVEENAPEVSVVSQRGKRKPGVAGTETRNTKKRRLRSAEIIDISFSDSDSDTQDCKNDIVEELDKILLASNLLPYKKYFQDTGICNVQDLLDFKDLSESRKEVTVERIAQVSKADGKEDVGYMQLLKFLDILEDWDFKAELQGRRTSE